MINSLALNSCSEDSSCLSSEANRPTKGIDKNRLKINCIPTFLKPKPYYNYLAFSALTIASTVNNVKAKYRIKNTIK